VPLEHARLGSFGHVRTPLVFSRSHFEPFRAPAMGEHNIDILTSVCGFSSEQARQLAAAGALE
jgi:hypothetical protein